MLHKAVFALLTTLVASALGSTLLPFNTDGNATFLTGLDDSCQSVAGSVVFFGLGFSSIYVCTNGVLSLDQSFTVSSTSPLPFFGRALIAPFWNDLDTRNQDGSGAGRVYYEAIPTGTTYSAQYDSYVRGSDPSGAHASFTASRIFQVTWSEVGIFPRVTFPNNTFQAAIVTDDWDYFVVFNYPEGLINFPLSGTTVGVAVGDSYNYFIPSFSRQNVSRAAYESNIGVPGVWLWNVGNSLPSPTFSQSPTASQSRTASQSPSQSPSLPDGAMVYRNIHGKSNALGYSVSAEGNEVAISQPSCSEYSQSDKACGKVYLLQTSSEGWWLKQYFQYLGKAVYSRFGTKVLLQNGWLLVQSEALYDTSSYTEMSAVYGFRYNPSVNRYVRKFSITSPISQSWQYYGSAIAMDGNFTFVSSPYIDTDGYMDNGIVFGYHYPKSIDRVQGPRYLTIKSPNIQSYENFGKAVAASAGLLVVSGGNIYSAVQDILCVFTYSMDNTTLVQTLYPSNSYSYFYGSNVIFDGYNLFVAAQGYSANVYKSGSVYRYTLNQYGTFEESDFITPYDAPYMAYFGISMAYNREGQYLVVGSTCGDTCGVRGSVYVVQNSGLGYWYQTKKSLGVSSGSDLFGHSVATNNDGIIIGAPYDSVTGMYRGALYLVAY